MLFLHVISRIREVCENKAPSLLVHTLRSYRWIPSVDGGFYTPGDMTHDSLPDDLPYDNQNGWLDAVEFGKAAQKRLDEERLRIAATNQARLAETVAIFEREEKARDLGLPIGIVNKLDELNPEQRDQAIEEFFSLIEGIRTRPSFPVRSVRNAEARAKVISEAAQDARSKERQARVRTVRVSCNETQQAAREYLRRLYTNQQGLLFCQVCQKVMPFV